MLITILALVFLLLVVLYGIFLDRVIFTINIKLSIFRKFIHLNNGIFTILFLGVFFIEQLLLMYVFYAYLQVSADAQFFIGLFALVVLTTATLEKFILEKKYAYLAGQVSKVTYSNEKNLEEMKALYDEGEKLRKENELLRLKLKQKR